MFDKSKVTTKVSKNCIRYQYEDVSFVVAKDSMGTQIASKGRFFPPVPFEFGVRDFGTIANAVDYLNSDNNLELAFEYFKTAPQPDMFTSTFNLFFGMLSQQNQANPDSENR